MGTAAKAEHQVLLCCAQEDYFELDPVLPALRSLARAVLVAGLGQDPARVAKTVGRYGGKASYFICRSENLDRSGARQVRNELHNAGVPVTNLFIVDVSSGEPQVIADQIRKQFRQKNSSSTVDVPRGQAKRGPSAKRTTTTPSIPTPPRAGTMVPAGSSRIASKQTTTKVMQSLSPLPGIRRPVKGVEYSVVKKSSGQKRRRPVPPSLTPTQPAAVLARLKPRTLASDTPLVDVDDSPAIEADVAVPQAVAHTGTGSVVLPVATPAVDFRARIGRVPRMAIGAAAGVLLLVSAGTLALASTSDEHSAVAQRSAPVSAATKAAPDAKPVAPAAALTTMTAAPQIRIEVPMPTPVVAAAPTAPEIAEVAESVSHEAVANGLRARELRALDEVVFKAEALPRDVHFVRAAAYCRNLNVDGVADWRLPTAGEMVSLAEVAELGKYNYWTQTTGDLEHHAILVFTKRGELESVDRKWRGARPLCVRTSSDV
jgi:hypothetical protein